MNAVQLVGRLTKDPDIKYGGANNTAVARFSIAVNRKFANDDIKADFPNILCFGKTAEFIEKCFHKGMAIGITGRIQTGSYTNKDGAKVYTTEVVADNVEFVESKNASQQNDSRPAPSGKADDGFMKIPDCIDEELPFN